MGKRCRFYSKREFLSIFLIRAYFCTIIYLVLPPPLVATIFKGKNGKKFQQIKKTNIFSQDNDGWTPLHAAAHWAQREACELLVESSANMEIKNCVGQTPFDVADPDVLRFVTRPVLSFPVPTCLVTLSYPES